MPTLSANAPDTVENNVRFQVGAVLSAGPPDTQVEFTLEHLVGPGLVPAWAPITVQTQTSANGAAVVSFPNVALAAPGMHGLFCVVQGPAGFVADDSESVLVR